ncbi:hypothetical protein [Paraburkholderia sp. EG304]|uniref:hypothetical protein n=1 Tax=Paraburkholderia sp. EG304 TaxID=3237015 RepID=UPI0039790BC9
MKIELYGSSQKDAALVQQEWNGDGLTGPQTALFASNDMTLQCERDGFHLYYLGYRTSAFVTNEDARKTAPEFARQVLNRMLSQISE